jgi:hypothetical protein
VAQSEPKSEVLPSDLAPEYLRILDDGTVLTVERAMLSNFVEHRLTVRFDPGSASESTLAFLNTLYLTYCGILGPLTSYAPECHFGKPLTPSE